MKWIILIMNLVLSFIGLPMLSSLLYESGHVEKNYRGQDIANSMGMIFIFVELISLSIYYVFTGDLNLLYFLMAIVFMGFIGFIDDSIGDTKIKGFKGHVKAFFSGNLTTGMIKALSGFFISFILSYLMSETWLDLGINTFIVALSINLLNLFDLRPGRSLKVFLFLGAIFIFLAGGENYFYLLSMIVITLVYLPWDLKARSMMGDTGANILGVTIGFYVIISQSLLVRSVYLILLFSLHLLAEKLSITKIIEKNNFLNYIDRLGR